ncbi:cupredoxin domain-containing protein [Pseudarthrobacter sp. SSS035]|uniref:cupredoxin domain-containing protein n=1 Tax=Pseudarthrobacter sp. SSS035 TaxID=2931399 RepID=UPI00200D0466|nr:cupredoxin domain-containing protein [Pseudarthrobacter sp. SSS035]
MRAFQAKATVLLMAALLLGGCGSGTGSPAASPGPGTATTGAVTPGAPVITIKDFEYGAPLTVAPGTIVTVTNMDSAGHTVTADQGQAFDVDVRGSGGTATFTAPSAPGSYPYYCTYHPNMRGTLIVK